MPRWQRENEQGDTVTITVGPEGATVLVQRIDGGREHEVLSLEDFEEAWLPWLDERFDDALSEALRGALRDASDAASYDDDQVP